MKHITFLWIGLCILTRLTLWAGGAASTSSNNGQTINTLAGSSYAIVRLAEPTSPAGLTPIRLTNSAYVLLKNRDNKAGYVWQNGQLTALTAPPFDTQSGDAWEALDINERGEVVGFTDLGYILDLEYWNFHNAVYWASPLANPRFLKPATEFKNAFPPWNGDYLIDDSFAECIDNNGVIYGKTYQLYANNSHGVSDISMVDGVRWDSADSDATRLGNGFDYVTSENRFDLGSVKYKIVKLKGGGVKTYKSVHVTDFNWDGYVIYAGITWQDTPGSYFDPVSVNENGQFIGSDVGPSSIGSVRSSVIKWGEGDQAPQEFGAEGTGLVINNAKDILTLNPEGVPLIWRRRPDNPEVYQKESVDLGDIADKWNLQAMLMNTDRVLAGLGTKIKDDQNNPISSPSPEPVLLVPAELAVDANRDGTITLASDLNPDPELSDQTTEKKPFFFPINDDDDNPGTTPQADYINTVVDGADDLKDFFPVFLDIKQLLTVLPPSDSVKYKLKQADGALNFVYTSLTRATAFDYKTAGPSSTGYGAGGSLPATFATTIPITSSGVELNGYFLDRIKNQDKGVILVEGRTSSVQPLVLTVEKDGVSITEISLHLMPIEIITINTFIPHNNVDDPDNLNPLNIASPAHVYGGDDRSSGSPLRAIWNKEGAHRSRQRFKIVPLRNRGDTDGIEDNSYINDTDGVRNDSLLNDVGATHKYHKASSLNASGNLTAAAKSDTILGDENLMVAKATASKYSGMEIIPEWISDNKLKVTCTLSLGNPLAPVIAGNQIDYVFILTLDYSDPKHPLYSLEGSHDGFPAYEVYIGGKRIYEHDPLATGEDVFSLLGSGEWDVNETTNHMNQTLR